MRRSPGSPGSAQDWLSFARADLALCRLSPPERAGHEPLCFHAQQAAEKAIKAVYGFPGRSFSFTHDLDELLSGLEANGVAIPPAVWEAADLARYAWEARYPGIAEPVTDGEHRDAVVMAERVLSWAERFVAQTTPTRPQE